MVKLILAAVVEQKMAYKEVAAKYNVTTVLIGKLVRGKKAGDGSLNKLKAKEEARDSKLKATVNTIEAFLERKQHIWRTS
jgi:transposase